MLLKEYKQIGCKGHKIYKCGTIYIWPIWMPIWSSGRKWQIDDIGDSHLRI